MRTTAVTAATVLLAGIAFTPTAEASAAGSGLIAFESSRVTADNPEGDIEIFSIGTDGTGLTQLTSNATFDRQPNWSADGKRIAFSQTVGGVFHVFTMDADGKHPADRSVNGGFFDVAPKWRPDGKRIAFSSSRGGGSGASTR